MKIRVIKGTLGYRAEGSLHPTPVGVGAVVEVPEETAERLISIGVAALEEAEYDMPGLNEESPESEIPDYSAMTFADLKAEATVRGIDTKQMKSKAAIIKALENDDETPPLIGVSEPL